MISKKRMEAGVYYLMTEAITKKPIGALTEQAYQDFLDYINTPNLDDKINILKTCQDKGYTISEMARKIKVSRRTMYNINNSNSIYLKRINNIPNKFIKNDKLDSEVEKLFRSKYTGFDDNGKILLAYNSEQISAIKTALSDKDMQIKHFKEQDDEALDEINKLTSQLNQVRKRVKETWFCFDKSYYEEILNILGDEVK